MNVLIVINSSRGWLVVFLPTNFVVRTSSWLAVIKDVAVGETTCTTSREGVIVRWLPYWSRGHGASAVVTETCIQPLYQSMSHWFQARRQRYLVFASLPSPATIWRRAGAGGHITLWTVRVVFCSLRGIGGRRRNNRGRRFFLYLRAFIVCHRGCNEVRRKLRELSTCTLVGFSTVRPEFKVEYLKGLVKERYTNASIRSSKFKWRSTPSDNVSWIVLLKLKN